MIRQILLILLLSVPSVVALTPLEAGTMEARVLILNEVTFKEETSEYYVKDATGKLSWYPRDDMIQEVKTLDVGPAGKQKTGFIEYSWEFPERKEEIRVEATIKTRNAIVPIRKKIKFPIPNVPQSVGMYLGDEEIIDQSPEIQQLAQQLASGKDDLYEVVYALADWSTTNIEYSLASLGEPAIQTSSEVLESRWGKCDEMTALFISLNRALGIPSRFVAGYAYTNSRLLSTEWGGHGWAEVWFPDVGWVPFDVTYGEYGYLDAGHVKLKDAPDAKEISIDYSASGRGFSIQTEQLNIFITPTKLTRNSDKRIDISLEAPYTKVGFGSAVLILATVKNTKDYYIATRLDLAQTTNTEMLSDTYQNILLKPRQTLTVPFLVKIDKNLDPGYQYKFPFSLSTRLGDGETTTIDVNSEYRSFLPQDFTSTVELYLEDPASSPEFSVMCDRPDPVYAGSNVDISCTVDGSPGEELTICSEECTATPIVDKGFTVSVSKDTEGIFTEKYRARKIGSQSDFFITTEFVTPTEMNINISAPTRTRVDDDIVVEIKLSATGAAPNDIKILTNVAHSSATQLVNNLPATIQLKLPGRALRAGVNDIDVRVTWTDELGTPGEASDIQVVSLTGAGITHKVKFFFLDMTSWFGGLVS